MGRVFVYILESGVASLLHVANGRIGGATSAPSLTAAGRKRALNLPDHLDL
jgi:hypothetical protein